MKYFLYLVCLCFIYCCNEVKKESNINFWLLYHKNSEVDTFAKHIVKPNPKDSLILFQTFKFNESNHLIKLYTNANWIGADGIGLAYELDTLGIILMKALFSSHKGHMVLHTNNDSIQALINYAIKHIQTTKELSDPNVIKFEVPE